MEKSENSASTNTPRAGFSISNLLGLESENMEKFQKLDEYSTSKDEETPRSTPVKPEKSKRKRASPDPEEGSDGGKRYRATFDKAQIFQMERVFLLNHYPDVAARSELSRRTGLSESQVQIWFQNRRAKWRKQQRKRRHEIPALFGLGYPTHLARLYPGYEPYGMFPYEYYNTDFWACAQQQIAAMHYTGIPAPGLSVVPSPPRSTESSPVQSPVSSPSSSPTKEVASAPGASQHTEGGNQFEVKNDTSLMSLRLKAKQHMEELEIDVTE
ncbi:homeobox protein prophet of Pit-1 [Nematostella vectensis]|nr:homeobox protein prophet of Pit-1 [Nematostella vectensis]